MSLPATIAPTDVLVAARLAVQSYGGKPDAMTVVTTMNGMPIAPHVVWEGSTTVDDWIKDFEAIPVGAGWGFNELEQKEFVGFANAASDSVRELIPELAGTLALPAFDRGITLAGHSRGGAIALLVAARLRSIYAKLPVRVITFGAPRPGTREWGTLYEALGIATVRVEVSYDPIVHGIPWWYGGAVGDTLHLDHDGTELGRIRGGWATVKYWLRWKLGDRYDHSVSGYQAAVEQWVLKNVDGA